LLVRSQPNPLATAAYYDGLSRWTQVAQFLGYGGGRRTLTVHRALADPRVDGRTTTTRLHDLLLECLPPLKHPRVLDAGCGFGGTLLFLASRINGTFTGLTLSARQADVGRRAIANAGLAGSVDVQVGNYDTPPPGQYEVIVAIESLAHSSHPAASLAALSSCLAPGGALAIVDDMPTPAATHSADLECFRNGWRVPVLFSQGAFTAALQANGLAVVVDRDLSAELRPRTLARIRHLEILNRVARRLAASAGVRAMLDSYHGGLALERLYRHGTMEYRMMVARKPETVSP